MFMATTERLSQAVLRLSGDLDAASRPQTQAQLQAIDADVAIIDLTDVRFLDGGALGLLVALRKRLRREGRLGIVKIIAPNPRIQRLFQISGLTKLFEMQESPACTQAA